MDADGPSSDIIFPIENGRVLKDNRVGGHLANYASMLVLSHFKGHPMGGFGGALKQLSIGCASNQGKVNIHSGGATLNQGEFWDKHAEQDDFIEAMAEAAETVVNHFGSNIAFVNIAWQPFGRLRLLRSSRRSLHEGHRHLRFTRSGGCRCCLPRCRTQFR